MAGECAEKEYATLLLLLLNADAHVDDDVDADICCII